VVSPRILGYARSRPRHWDKTEQTFEAWLTDQAWIVRRRKLPGTEDGTPNFTTEEAGPYACKLTAPVTREAEQRDHQSLEVTNSLAIATDEEPRERDRIRIREAGRAVANVYRIEGTVNPRPAAWGQTPVYQVDLVMVQEY
jgi:hypothetical protein